MINNFHKVSKFIVIVPLLLCGFGLFAVQANAQTNVNDYFIVSEPFNGQNVKDLMKLQIRAFDNEQSGVKVESKLFDSTCNTSDLGRIIEDSIITNTRRDFDWISNKTLLNSAIADGQYCIKTCGYFVEYDNPYKTCINRIINLNNENTNPNINSFPTQLTLTEGTTFTYQVEATDLEQSNLTYQLLTTNDYFSIDQLSGLITSAPLSSSGNNVISFPLEILVSDGLGGKSYQSFNVNVYASRDIAVAGGSTDNTTGSNNLSDSSTKIVFLSPKPGQVINSKSIVVQWELETDLEVSSLELFYSIDKGQNWVRVSENLSLTKKYFIWNDSSIVDREYSLLLRANLSNGQVVDKVSENFIIDRITSENSEIISTSVPLITNVTPENNTQLPPGSNIVIGGQIIPSAGETIQELSLSVQLNEKSITQACTLGAQGKSFTCDPIDDLPTGRHIVAVSILDTANKEAKTEWIFSILDASEVPSSNGGVETINLFGRDIPRSTLLIFSLICCIGAALLFVPWILYSMWLTRRHNNNPPTQETLPPSPEILPNIYATPQDNSYSTNQQSYTYIDPYAGQTLTQPTYTPQQAANYQQPQSYAASPPIQQIQPYGVHVPQQNDYMLGTPQTVEQDLYQQPVQQIPLVNNPAPAPASTVSQPPLNQEQVSPTENPQT